MHPKIGVVLLITLSPLFVILGISHGALSISTSPMTKTSMLGMNVNSNYFNATYSTSIARPNANVSHVQMFSNNGGWQVYLLWQENMGNKSSSFLVQSSNGGQTFGGPTNLSNGTIVNSTAKNAKTDHNLICINPHGVSPPASAEVYILQECKVSLSSHTDPYLMTSTDGGVTFGPLMNIYFSPATDSTQSFLFLDNTGKVMATWVEVGEPRGGNTIHTKCSTRC